MTSTRPANNFFQRLLGAAALDTAIYEEVESDPRAGVQAGVVVVLSSMAGGIGARGLDETSIGNIAFFSILALMAWACWALLVFEIGTRLLPESDTSADVGQLMRTIGFASTPGLIRIFGFIPGVTVPAFIVSSIWMLLAMIVAVRQALDYKQTGRAVAVCMLGWVLALTLALVLGMFLGPTVE